MANFSLSFFFFLIKELEMYTALIIGATSWHCLLPHTFLHLGSLQNEFYFNFFADTILDLD